MDRREKMSVPLQLLSRFLQFVVFVLIVVNAFIFIDNLIHPRTGTIINIENLAMKYKDPDEENILEMLQ